MTRSRAGNQENEQCLEQLAPRHLEKDVKEFLKKRKVSEVPEVRISGQGEEGEGGGEEREEGEADRRKKQ